MNMKQLISNLFSTRVSDQLPEIEAQGERDAELAVGAYFKGFRRRSETLMLEMQGSFLGYDSSIEAEYETMPDDWNELRRLAKERGITIPRGTSKEGLIELLNA